MPHSTGKKKRRAIMLGVGLDSDGHKRLTTGTNFALVGGSEQTHEAMTEKAMKINEKREEVCLLPHPFVRSEGTQLYEIKD